MKKLSTILLASLMAITINITSITDSYAARFSDLSEHKWAEKAINNMADLGVFNGYPDGTFKPGNPVTRVEALAMLSNLYPSSEVDKVYQENKSKYIQRLQKFYIPDWSYSAITFSLVKGVIPDTDAMINSIIDDKSKKPITAQRYEVAVFAVRALGFENEMDNNAKLNFKDNKDIPSQAVPFIDVLIKKGVLSAGGDGTGNFNPNKTITRAEMAAILSNAYKYSPKANLGKKPIEEKPAHEPTTFTIEGRINLITYNEGNMTVSISKDGKTYNYMNKTDKVKVYQDNIMTDISSLSIGQDVTLKFENGLMTSIYISSNEKRISGTLDSISTIDKTLTIKTDQNTMVKYPYDDNTKVMINDEIKTVDHLINGAIIDIYVKNDKITKISAQVSKYDIQGEVIENSKDGMTIKEDNDKKNTYPVNKDARIYRNDERIDDKNLVVPTDKVLATIENGEIVRLEIKSTLGKYLSSKLQSIEITKDYTDIGFVDRDGNSIKARINQDTKIRINDNLSAIEDLKIGYEMDIYTDGGMATEIYTNAKYKNDTVVGTVIRVELLSRYIDIETREGKLLRIFYNMNTKIEDLDGRTMEAREIYEDDNLTSIGVIKGGDMEATRLILDI